MADLRFAYGISKGIPQAESSFQIFEPYLDPEDVVIEVGAGHGGGTLRLSEKVKYVYSFEPNPYSHRIVKYFAKERRNLSLFNAAVGDKLAETRLNLVFGEPSAFASSVTMLTGQSYQSHLRVPMVKLDDMHFSKPPSVMIIDCEGYEMQVLKGAKRTLETVEKVFIETHVLSNGHNTIDEIFPKICTLFDKVGAVSTDEGLIWVMGLS